MKPPILHSNSIWNNGSYQIARKASPNAGWGEFVRQLEYKGKWAGRQVVNIERWFPSSKRCHHCGHVAESMPLAVRTWDCPDCGATGTGAVVNTAV